MIPPQAGCSKRPFGMAKSLLKSQKGLLLGLFFEGKGFLYYVDLLIEFMILCSTRAVCFKLALSLSFSQHYKKGSPLKMSDWSCITLTTCDPMLFPPPTHRQIPCGCLYCECVWFPCSSSKGLRTMRWSPMSDHLRSGLFHMLSRCIHTYLHRCLHQEFPLLFFKILRFSGIGIFCLISCLHLNSVTANHKLCQVCLVHCSRDSRVWSSSSWFANLEICFAHWKSLNKVEDAAAVRTFVFPFPRPFIHPIFSLLWSSHWVPPATTGAHLERGGGCDMETRDETGRRSYALTAVSSGSLVLLKLYSKAIFGLQPIDSEPKLARP